MEEITDNLEINQEEEVLTPKHSIPPNIHILNVSGSKGHFSAQRDGSSWSSYHGQSHSLSMNYDPSPKKPQRNSKIPSIKQNIFEGLYQDAAKRSAVKEKLTSYASIQKEKEAESFRIEKKISKSESTDLFERLNKEAELRNERVRISAKMKEEEEIKVLKNPKINKSMINLKQDVVTRLLQYGENTKRKNAEKLRLKQEREEEEIKKLLSMNQKAGNDSYSFSSLSTPGKNNSFKVSPGKSEPFSTKLSFLPVNPLQSDPVVMRSSNSPDKIIQKIQNLAANTKVSAFESNAKSAKPIKNS